MMQRKWNETSKIQGVLFRQENRFFHFIFFCVCFFFFSCSENEEPQSVILSEVLAPFSQSQLEEVIACAASKEGDNSIAFIYYYPIPEATNIQYFETSNANVDPNDFSNYILRTLEAENVFGGYLKRFIRSGNDEVFSIVTFEANGKFHKSNPIRLKQASKPTEYTYDLTIDSSITLMPIFSWNDGVFPDNAIYFQVISDENNDFISGTYTFDQWFQYYNLSNVVLDINREVPESLILNNLYNFSMLAVSLDNWVNLVIEKPFTAE